MPDKRLSDLWKRKDDYIKSRLDWLSKKVDRSQQILLNNLTSGFAGEFSVDEFGKLKATTRNMRLAIKMDQFFNELDEQTLRKVNTQYGQDMLRLTPLNERYYNTLIPDATDVIKSISEKVGFIEQAIGIKYTQVEGENFLLTGKYNAEIIKGGYLDNITKMPEVRQQMKNYVIKSVANKKGFSEYLRGMKEIVVGTKTRDGALERYYKQYAYDTFNQTDAAINKHYADNLNLTWFVYSGGIIGTSRAFCIKRSQKVFNTKETETWKCDSDLIGKPKNVKCDQRYNPLIERGRWNCRHTLRYITSEMACDMGREDACDITVEEFNTNMTSLQEIEWKERIMKDSEKFVEEYGLGSCGPVADNITNVLQRQGIDARVMFCEYTTDPSNPINTFGHYVSVELKGGKPVRIFDPTNAVRLKPISNLKNNIIPDQYMDYEIFEKTGRSVDDGIFTNEMVKWWENKIH